MSELNDLSVDERRRSEDAPLRPVVLRCEIESQRLEEIMKEKQQEIVRKRLEANKYYFRRNRHNSRDVIVECTEGGGDRD